MLFIFSSYILGKMYFPVNILQHYTIFFNILITICLLSEHKMCFFNLNWNKLNDLLSHFSWLFGTYLPILLEGAWLGSSGLMGWMRLLVPAAAWHLGDKLANMAEGLQPRFSRRRRDEATRDLGAFPPAGAGASEFLSPSPSLVSGRRSETEVLSNATLMGDGQAGERVRKGRGEEALARVVSVMPEYTARWGTGVVKRHSCKMKWQET